MREWTILDLQAAYRSGETTPRDVCREYLARIEEIDRDGPGVNSVIEVNPDAIAIAEEATRAYKTPRNGEAEDTPVGLLHGIPVLIKDNIDTGDQMKTTAGSRALVDEPTPKDAYIVKRLRAEGAIILGKTNLSEWANFRSSRSNSGWSSRGGQTRNPYVLDRTPCGSSSGSGAAIAANLAVVAIGTETDGSVTCPSAQNSLVGLKPTMGLISRTGIIPISASQDTAGPMARTVTDAAILLEAIAGADPEDEVTAGAGELLNRMGAGSIIGGGTSAAPEAATGEQSGAGRAASVVTSRAAIAASLSGASLEGRRIGIGRGGFLDSHRHRESLAVFNAAVEAMRAAGAETVDVEMPSMEEVSPHELTVLLYEFKAGLEAYFARRGGSIHGLADIIAWNKAHADVAMPVFGQEHMEEALECGPLTDEKYQTALRESRRLAGEDGLLKLLEEQNLDAIAGASNGPAWIIDHMIGDYYSGGRMSTAPAVSGAPHLTLPIGYVNQLPMGISLVGALGSDADLLAMGFALESRINARRPPEFIPSLGLR